MDTVFTFQLIYIHANKEIDATKLYWLKNPRIFQDLFLWFNRPNQKSQLPLGLWIISYLFSIALTHTSNNEIINNLIGQQECFFTVIFTLNQLLVIKPFDLIIEVYHFLVEI